MEGWDKGTLIAIFIGMAIVVIILGFVSPYIADRGMEAAMPELTPGMPANLGIQDNCPAMCGYDPSYPECRNNTACTKMYSCAVWWYQFCVVGEIV